MTKVLSPLIISGVKINFADVSEILRLPSFFQGEVKDQNMDLFDHMNVMWYTHFFDEGTFNFFDSIGVGVQYHQKTGNAMFALSQHTSYLAELRSGDKFEIYTKLIGFNQKRIHFVHYLLKVEGNLRLISATTELLGGHVVFPERKTAPFPESAIRKLTLLFEEHKELGWESQLCGSISL